MTVKETIDYIQSLIKNIDTETGIYEDRFIWKVFTTAKAKVLTSRLRRFNTLLRTDYTTICIKLETSLSHECECFVHGCKVMKSIHPIPKYLTNRNVGTLSIFSPLNNKSYTEIDQEDWLYYKDHDVYKNELLFSIVNDHIILWNSKSDLLLISAVWEDITELQDIQDCDNSYFNCLNFMKKDVNLPADLFHNAIQIVFDQLNLPLQLKEDQTNDSNAEITQ